MRSWDVRTVVQRSRIRARGRRAAPHDHDDDGEPCGEEQGRRCPQEPGARRHRRPQQDKVAVAMGHERVDLGVALAIAHEQLDFAAEVRGERRIRVGDAFAAAYDAAQVADEPLITRLLSGIVEALAGVHGARGCGEQENCDERQLAYQRPSPSAGKSGTNSRCQTSMVIGPTYFLTTIPLASMRKVSGAPVTPQSIAVRPSGSYATDT